MPDSGVLGYFHPFRSVFDGTQCVVIFTGFGRKSTNIKTGAMIQTHVMRARVDPLRTRREYLRSVCGDCDLRAECYVRWERAPLEIYRAHRRRRYDRLADFSVFSGRHVRIGSTGDPASVPGDFWSRVVDACRHHTGYTHGWRRNDTQHLRGILMASVSTEEGFIRAQRAGWATFRARIPGSRPWAQERQCPAAKEAGHRTTCERCGRCDARHGSVSIELHGAKARRVTS